MGKKKTVLVATWGSPIRWKKVKYRVALNDGNSETDQEIESESTLKPLLETVKPDKVILIVLDTLFNAVDNNNNPPKKGFEKGLDGKKKVTYEDVLIDVKKRVETYVREQLGLDYNVRLFGWDGDGAGDKVIDLVVAPGVGAFPNVTVEGNVKDFHRYVLYALANLLPVEDLSLYFDMTHGVNYMPVLTYRALGSLLRLLAYVRNVELTVVDSEPFQEGAKKVFNIIPVEHKTLEPAPIKGLIDGKDEWNAFISSLANGFPLVFLTFYPEIKEVEHYLSVEYRNEFIKCIHVTQKNREWIIVRDYSLPEGFKVASKLMYAIKAFTEVGFKRDDIPTLMEILDVNRRVFHKVSTLEILTRNQMKSLARDIVRYEKQLSSNYQENWEKCWCILGSIQRPGFRCWDKQSKRRFVRNFVAHCGFESNIMLITRRDNLIYFKYYDTKSAIKAAVEAHTKKYKNEKDEYIHISCNQKYICSSKGKKHKP